MTIPTAEAVTSRNAVGIGAQEPPLRIEPKYAPLTTNRDVNHLTRNAAALMQVRIGVGADRIRGRHVAGNRRSASLACRRSEERRVGKECSVGRAVLDLDGIRARRR